MSKSSRRHFLRAMGGAVTASTILGLGVGTASASITVSGRILAYNDDPVRNRRLANYSESSFNVYTDSDGRFTAEVNEGARISLTLMAQGERELNPRRNGVPFVYSLGPFYVDQSDTDLGDIVVPRGYLVDMRALDSNGDPVEGATPEVRHDGSGMGRHYISTNENGWAQLDGANFRGIEASGRVELSMSIPLGGGEFKLSKYVTVDEPKVVTFQVGSGVTVSNAGGTDGPTAMSTPTDTATPTANIPTDTATPTANVPTDTTMRTSTDRPMTTGNNTRTQSTSVSRRGFLANGDAAGDFGPLDDPFVLTVGGFAMSVAGIVHQMMRGN